MIENKVKDLLSEHGINPKDAKKSKKEKKKEKENVEQESEETNKVESKENKESQESNKNTNNDSKDNVDNIINKYMNDTYNSSNFKYTTITYTKPICRDDEEMEDNYNEQELQNRINILKENNKDNDNIIAILESLVHIENKYSKIKDKINEIDSKLDKQTLYHIDIYPICFLIGLAIISIFWYFIIH